MKSFRSLYSFWLFVYLHLSLKAKRIFNQLPIPIFIISLSSLRWSRCESNTLRTITAPLFLVVKVLTWSQVTISCDFFSYLRPSSITNIYDDLSKWTSRQNRDNYFWRNLSECCWLFYFTRFVNFIWGIVDLFAYFYCTVHIHWQLWYNHI